MATPIPLTVDGAGPEGAIPVTISGVDVSDKTQIAALTNATTVGVAFADLEAARTAHNALVAKVNQIIAALKA